MPVREISPVNPAKTLLSVSTVSRISGGSSWPISRDVSVVKEPGVWTSYHPGECDDLFCYVTFTFI